MRNVPVLLERGTPRAADRDRILQRFEQRASGVECPQSARVRKGDERRAVTVEDAEPVARDRPGRCLVDLPNLPAHQQFPITPDHQGSDPLEQKANTGQEGSVNLTDLRALLPASRRWSLLGIAPRTRADRKTAPGQRLPAAPCSG